MTRKRNKGKMIRKDHSPELIAANKHAAESLNPSFIFQPHNFKLHCGNILQVQAEAIVNAANECLTGGGGIDGVIHAVCGPRLLEECLSISADSFGARCHTGNAIITGGGDSHFKYVIHTVGPYLDENNSPNSQFLRNCYVNTLKICKEKNISSVVFPCISTGFYGFPMKEAAEIALTEISKWTEENRNCQVFVAVFNSVEQIIYKKLLGQPVD